MCDAQGFPAHLGLERRYADNDDVVFLYVNVAPSPTPQNGYAAGLAKLERHEARGLYAFDAGADGKPPVLLRDYFILGTPWSVVIDHTGVVRFSKPTQHFAGPLRATVAHAIRYLERKRGG
ncbi:MAG: hypothetical protein D6731_14205 [Planctomycetota bacterium]|nr:MAG: hypothetical protein D6731_14205 [Planctomycetota bacterium]